MTKETTAPVPAYMARIRKQIRTAFGARPPTEEDEERWTQWMADELCVLIALPDALRRRVVTCKR